jgi:hypothetical protein
MNWRQYIKTQAKIEFENTCRQDPVFIGKVSDEIYKSKNKPPKYIHFITS